MKYRIPPNNKRGRAYVSTPRTILKRTQEKFVSEVVGTGLFQYFIKVIPTHYKGKDGAFDQTALLLLAYVCVCVPRVPLLLGSPLLSLSNTPPGPGHINTGETIRTNRISVTERFKPLHREGQARLQGDSHAHDDRTSVLPGVFFIYDLSPFAVRLLSVSIFDMCMCPALVSSID